MFKRLLQAATLTFLLNLLAQMNPPDAPQPTTASSSPTVPKLLLSFR